MSAPVILSAAATKGGVGKTTLIANVSAVLADIGLRVLMIDCDVQPSLSKYYPISATALQMVLLNYFSVKIPKKSSARQFPIPFFRI